MKVCIFSSGSVQAQKLLFQYSEAGDLTRYLLAYFDTSVGTKKSPASYANISEQLSVPAAEIIFLSDVEDELNAARETQMKTIQVLRDSVVQNTTGHLMVNTFDDIESLWGAHWKF
jgi:enolase-phosphatase E1